MDKYEYRVKTEQMQEYMEKKQYKKAMEIADTIDWRRVKNVATLNSVSEIYEYNGEYQKSRDILFVAFDRSPGSRKIAYRLGLLALKINDVEEAADCYEEFVKLAPKDPNQYILKYRILSAQGAPLSEQIAALEDFKKSEYIEKWAFELAKLYHDAGMTAECLEECDDLILWFSEGKYVYQAMELKMQYKPLTPLQQEKYDAWPGSSKKPRPLKRNTSAKMPVLPNEQNKESAPAGEEEQQESAGAAERETADLKADEGAAAAQNSSIKKVVKGATLQEALANGMAFASGMRSVEKTVARVKEGIRQVTGQIHMEALINSKKEEEKTEEAASAPAEETLEIEEPETPQVKEPVREEKPVRIKTDKKTSALRATGQMRIEEILQEWESKQRANAEAIERQREEDDERLRRERDEIGLQRELERREAERRARGEGESREEDGEDAVKKLAEKEALRKAAERKAAEEKAAEERAALKAAEARKAAAEEAARKAEEAALARKAAAEEAARKAEEEAAARKAAAEEAVRKAEEEARKITEEALRKAGQIAARKAAGEASGKSAEDSETEEKTDASAEEAADLADLMDGIPDIDLMVEGESESLDIETEIKKEKPKVKQTTKKTVAADRAEEKQNPVDGKTQRIPDDIVRLMEELGEDASEPEEDVSVEEIDEKLLSGIVEDAAKNRGFDEGALAIDDLKGKDLGKDAEGRLKEESDGELEEDFEESDGEFEEDFEGSDEEFEEEDFEEESGEDFAEEFEEEGFEEESDEELGEGFEESDEELGEDFEKSDEEFEEDFEESDGEFGEDFEESDEEFEEEDFEEESGEEFGEDFEESDDEFEEDFEESDDGFEEEDFEEESDDGFEEEDFEEESDDGFEEEDFEEESEEEFEEEDFEEDEFEEDSEDGFEEEDLEEDEFEEEDFEEESDEDLEEGYEDDSEDEFEEDSDEDFEEDYIEDEFEEEGFGEEDFEEEDFEDEDLEESEEEDFEEADEDEFESEDFEEELEIEEPSEEEIQARIKKAKGSGVPFDTGFVVTGRYDLSATSEIGLKAGLTEEQKKLFSYFVPVRGMSEQIVEVLDNDRRARKEGTSKTGNLLVIGRKGSGKTVLAVDIVKAIQKQRNLKQGKVAIVTGESLNKKELTNIIQKLRGGAIIVEKAGKLNSRTIKELNRLMERKTGEMLFVLEDQRKPLERILTANPEFKKKFNSKLELPVFVNDELVTFGQTYAKENGYKLDEMGILALYSRIDVMQREDHAVSVAEVKDIMDEAIEHSQKANVKHLARRVFGRGTDESDRIILKEEDFKI